MTHHNYRSLSWDGFKMFQKYDLKQIVGTLQCGASGMLGCGFWRDPTRSLATPDIEPSSALLRSQGCELGKLTIPARPKTGMPWAHKALVYKHWPFSIICNLLISFDICFQNLYWYLFSKSIYIWSAVDRQLYTSLIYQNNQLLLFFKTHCWLVRRRSPAWIGSLKFTAISWVSKFLGLSWGRYPKSWGSRSNSLSFDLTHI